MSDDVKSEQKKSKRQLEKEERIKTPLLNRKERDRRAWYAHKQHEEAQKAAHPAEQGPTGGYSRPVNNPGMETDMMKPLSSLRERVLKSRAKMKARWRER